MYRERRAPHTVISVATSHDRGDMGDSRQYSQARRANPEPQQTSAMLASRSLTLSTHTKVRAVRTVPRPATAVIVPLMAVDATRGRRGPAARSVAAFRQT